MTSADLKNYSIVLMAVGVFTLTAIGAYQSYRIGDQTASALFELTQTAKQTKQAAFEVRAAAKAARDEWESREYQRARLTTLRLGEQSQIVLARINRELLPQLIGTARSANLLVANTDNSLNRELLPQLTRTSRNLADLAAAFQADEQKIAAELVNSVRQGQASIDQVNRLLESDQIPAILSNLNRTTGELAGSSANIKLMTDRWPEMASEINKILKTGRQWQKPVMIAGLLANIAKIFF